MLQSLLSDYRFLLSIASIALIFTYFKFKKKKSQQQFITLTLDELHKYDGTNKDLPLYIGCKGKIYDVTENAETYVNSAYKVFLGREASRLLAKMSTNVKDLEPEGSLEGLSEKELKTLDEWETYYEKKYKFVGTIKM